MNLADRLVRAHARLVGVLENLQEVVDTIPCPEEGDEPWLTEALVEGYEEAARLAGEALAQLP